VRWCDRGTAHQSLDGGEEAARWRWNFGLEWRRHGRGREQEGTTDGVGVFRWGGGPFIGPGEGRRRRVTAEVNTSVEGASYRSQEGGE
jgi:hypothetical protein